MKEKCACFVFVVFFPTELSQDEVEDVQLKLVYTDYFVILTPFSKMITTIRVYMELNGKSGMLGIRDDVGLTLDKAIIYVPASAACPDHLGLSAWTCLMSTLQSGLLVWLMEPDSRAWNLSSTLELTCILFSGIAGSGLQYFIQSWCISRRGPLFSVMFSPLSTVIITVLAAIFLHEEIFVGSLMGSAAVIAGLYVVLWGKSKEMEERKLVEANMVSDSKEVDDSCALDLEQPLLASTSQVW